MYLLRKNDRGEIEGTVISELYKSPYSLNWAEEWAESKMDSDILQKILKKVKHCDIIKSWLTKIQKAKGGDKSRLLYSVTISYYPNPSWA